jgi:hypothetical protein
MKGTVVSPEGEELPVNLLELTKFKEGEYEKTDVLSGDKITGIVIVYDSLGFAKGLPINTVASILAQKEIRGTTLILNKETFKSWMHA